ncbi:MAG: hypothetical protein IT210_01440 [Armatimonadetes bacterium]|nr:hypothetical protein [Armatimonadota bacterium]
MARWTALWVLQALAAAPAASPYTEAVGWLEKKSAEMIRACRRETRSGIAAFPPQVGSGYEAFWLRDYAYMLEGNIGAFSGRELKDAYLFFLAGQREDGAMVDCIKFDGTPVYMPGYGTMGKNPVADGSQFTVDMAWHTYRKTKDREMIAQTVDKLVKAMRAVPRNPKTGLTHIVPGPEWDRCPYGFTDSVRKQGDELFSSLLFVQASRQLADLLKAAGRSEEAKAWRKEAGAVAAQARRIFWDKSPGLFRAATVQCREPDIWGSAFAVYLGVASRSQAEAVARYFKEHYGEIVKRGQVRHTPGGVWWEVADAREEYQNGAYWATPVGWFVYALDLADPSLAEKTVIDMANDFRETGDVNECVNDRYKNVPNYVVSAALPLDGIRAMEARRKRLARTPRRSE